MEDEISVGVTCRLLLETLGYKVLLAETPGEALKHVERSADEIRLLLTDVVLPGMNGRQLATRISTLKPEIKVLFMSGYSEDVIALHGVIAQNTAYMVKPFSRNELAYKVRGVLDGS